jgi:transposase
MMGRKERHFAPLIEVSLEELVPQDHFYRNLERTLDLSFVRTLAKDTYAHGGRPSIDPVVFFKLQLIMFFEDIRSERLLMQHAADRLSVRWYLGYDLGEPLPDHSSLTRIRARYGVEIFRHFFEAIVEQCQQAGLVWGKELYVDATKVNANASLDSVKPRFYVEEHLNNLFGAQSEVSPGETGQQSPQAEAVESQPVEQQQEMPIPMPLPTSLSPQEHEHLAQENAERHDWIEQHGRPDRDVIRGSYRRMADFVVSTTDPDATVMPTKGDGRHLGYHTHYLVDGGKSRIILGVLVTPSEVMENQPMLDLIFRARFRHKLWPEQATGDTTYGTIENIVAMHQQHIRAYVPLPDCDKRTSFYGKQQFRYDAQRDVYICPNNAVLPLHTYAYTEHEKRYQGDAATCNACPLKPECTTSNRGRVIKRHFDEEYVEQVRMYHATEPYQKAIRKRSVWVEPLFAEGKDWHGMRRFRLRRLWRVNCEALMRAAGQNIKRLLKKRGWGRRPWPQGAVNALSEPPREGHLQLAVPARTERALACEEQLHGKSFLQPACSLDLSSYFLPIMHQIDIYSSFAKMSLGQGALTFLCLVWFSPPLLLRKVAH